MRPSASRWREATGRMATARQHLVSAPHLPQVGCSTGGYGLALELLQPEGSSYTSPRFAFSSQAEQTHKCASFSWLVGRSSLRETLWMGIYSMSQELQVFRWGERNSQAVTVLKIPQHWSECYYDL